MADYTPVYEGGAKPFTGTASAAVTGGRLAAVSGDGTLGHAAVDSAIVVGVFAHDAGSGARVSVWPLSNVVHEITAPGAVAQAVAIVAAANGEIAAAAAQTGLALLGVSTHAKANGKVRFVGR
jgi:hypothetical protein